MQRKVSCATNATAATTYNGVPLIPAELFLSVFMDRDEEDEESGHRIEKLRITLATQYMQDALACRRLQILARSPWQRMAQYITGSRLYMCFVYFLLCAQIVYTPWEGRTECDEPSVTRFLEVVSVFVYVVDLVLTVVSVSPIKACYSGWMWLNLVLVTGMLTDQLACKDARFRAARGLLIFMKSDRLRRTVSIMLYTMLATWDLFLLYAIALTFYALIGEACFGGLYNDLGDLEYVDAFANFRFSALSLFVLTTSESFPQILNPALARSTVPLIPIVFFTTFNLLLVYIVLPLFLAAVYNAFEERSDTLQLERRVRRYHALLATYHVLLDDGKRQLNLERWTQLALAVKPATSVEEARWMFAFLDKDSDGLIDLEEFVLGSYDVFNFNFDEYRRERAEQTMTVRSPFSERFREQLRCLVCGKYFVHTVYLCAVVHTVLMIYSPCPNPPAIAAACSVFLAFSVLETSIRICAFPLIKYWRTARVFDLVCVSVGVILEWIVPAMISVPPQILFASRSVRVLRLLTLDYRMCEVLKLVYDCRAIVGNFFVLFVLLSYMFACLAELLFRNSLPSDYEYGSGTDDLLQPHPVLDTFKQCASAMIQIALTNDWQTLMYPNILEGDRGFYSFMFFVAFYIILAWFSSNIMTAMLLDAYMQWQTRRQREKPRAAEESVRRTSVRRVSVGTCLSSLASQDRNGMYSRSDTHFTENQMALMKSVLASGGTACERCTNCVVFVASVPRWDVCSCGHKREEHSTVGLTGEAKDDCFSPVSNLTLPAELEQRPTLTEKTRFRTLSDPRGMVRVSSGRTTLDFSETRLPHDTEGFYDTTSELALQAPLLQSQMRNTNMNVMALLNDSGSLDSETQHQLSQETLSLETGDRARRRTRSSHRAYAMTSSFSAEELQLLRQMVEETRAELRSNRDAVRSSMRLHALYSLVPNGNA